MINTSKIWQGGGFLFNDNDVSKNIDILCYGIENGLYTIDTAENYGNGTSEEIIGKAIKNFNRDDVFISTKVSVENLGYNNVIKSCDGSLKRLDIGYIDSYCIHWHSPTIPIEETISALLYLKNSGKIRNISIGNFTFKQLIDAYSLLDGQLLNVQMEYNLLNRFIEEDIIPFCEKNNIIMASYSSMNKIKFDVDNVVLNELAKKYDKKVSQILLSWILYKNNVNAIIKSRNIIHINENIDAMGIVLDIEDYLSIGKVFENRNIKILPRNIYCDSTDGSERGVLPTYKTVQDAIENKLNFVPSPAELAIEIRETKKLSKPIYVKMEDNLIRLVGGSCRYWAWVIAFGLDTEIECVII